MLYKYIDREYPGGAKSRLWLLEPEKDWNLQQFTGKPLPCCTIVKSLLRPARWPQTLYWLCLTPGVVPVHLVCDSFPVWVLDYHSWEELATDMRWPVHTAKQLLENFPDAYQYLEEQTQQKTVIK